LTDYHGLYDRGLSQKLPEGETVLALSEARRPRGTTPGRPPAPSPPVDDAAPTAAVRAADMVLSGIDLGSSLASSNAPIDWLTRVFWGRTAWGPPTSLAAGFAAAVPEGRHLVVVTDRRLVVFRSGRFRGLEKSSRPVPAAKLWQLWEVPRPDVTGARLRRHRLHHSRLRIELRDGSWLELTGPLCLGRERAAALVAALTAPDGARPPS
jgi:hypothetical protein